LMILKILKRAGRLKSINLLNKQTAVLSADFEDIPW
jgi:hypothetical protein